MPARPKLIHGCYNVSASTRNRAHRRLNSVLKRVLRGPMNGSYCSGRGSGPADFPPAGTIRVCCSIFSVPADKHLPTCIVGCSRYRLEMRRPAACISTDAGSFIWTTSGMFGSSVSQANSCRQAARPFAIRPNQGTCSGSRSFPRQVQAVCESSNMSCQC